jgi:cytochrome c biogenesis protein CcmG/thiol:disulfide interchange protein DsbE
MKPELSREAVRTVKRRLLIGIGAGAAAAVAVALYLLTLSAPVAALGVGVGDRPPAFRLPDASGRTVALQSFVGRPIVLNFFATWCGPCNEEAPALAALARAYQGRVHFVGVDLAVSESNPEAVASFVRRNGITYPILLDETGQVSVQYEVAAVPVTFVIDKDGIIRYVFRSRVTHAELESALASVLRR